MALANATRRAASWGLATAKRLSFIAPLATRITIGLGYFHTGLGKLEHFDRTVRFFASVHIPFPAQNAALVGGLELVGGCFLLAGLFTRLFAGALSSSMLVALMTADRVTFLASWGSAGDTTPTDVASFVFLLFLLWLVFFGPGPVSADRYVHRALFGKQGGNGSR